MCKHRAQLALPPGHVFARQRSRAAPGLVAEMNPHGAIGIRRLEAETAERGFVGRHLFVRTLKKESAGRVEPRLMRPGARQQIEIGHPFRRAFPLANAPETELPVKIGVARHRHCQRLAASHRHRFGKTKLKVEIGADARGFFGARRRLR